MHAIFEIDVNRRTPKYQQIINSVTKAIKDGRFRKGDRLDSINELSNGCLLSRDTVQRAYDLLEKEKIIEAVKGKGFYINRTDIVVQYRVLLIFNKLSNYKKMIYDAFVQTLGKKGAVELRIHHTSTRVLEDIVSTDLGIYDYYVIMPHFYENMEEACRILDRIPREKLIVLDKKMPFPIVPARSVYQDFENDIYDALQSGLSALSKYEKLIYVHPAIAPYPPEIMTGFRKFCTEYRFAFSVISEIRSIEDVRKGEAYIVIEDTDLVNIIKNCRRQNLRIGKDVGIISYNETPLKQMLLDGITVISTDHKKMGEAAARMILDNEEGSLKNPFTLILRNSL